MSMIFLGGGARSGKSTLALRVASGAAGASVTFIATAEARDDEMRLRIDRHRAERPAAWTTLVAPCDLAGAVATVPDDHVIIVDCLSLWVSNVLLCDTPPEEIEASAADVAGALTARKALTVVVSNEVGLGIVPVNDLARAYRDVLGRVNQTFAGAAQRAFFCVVGHVVELRRPTDIGLPLGPIPGAPIPGAPIPGT